MRKKDILDLAIIIPTLNEEDFIGCLLDSLAHQSVLPKEIVVVDVYSADQTVVEVRKRQKSFPKLQVFRILQYTIARQRNFGASKTSANNLLFLDADMQLKGQDTLEKYFKEVLDRGCDCAAATNLPDPKYWKDQIFFKAENLLFRSSQFVWPVVTARNLYFKRDIFSRIGGFNETMAVAEDQELVHRLIKNGGAFSILKTVNLHTSTRRVMKEGRTRYAIKMILFGLNIMIRGHKQSRVKYEFGQFKKEGLR